MYQKTLMLFDWIVVFCLYFFVLSTTSFSRLILPHLDKNTVDAVLNLVINTVVGLVFISFLGYLIKNFRKTTVASYIWLAVFLVITVFFLFKVEVTRERLHFLGYGVMSLALYRALRHKIGTKMLYVWAAVIIMVFAILDENLQSFMAMGSSFELKDIGIDWLSGLLAQFLILLVARPKLKDIEIKLHKSMNRLERMKNFKLNHKIVLLVLFCFIFANNAYANYLDPGYGSYFLQVVLAVLLGAGFAVKVYWKKIKDFLARIFSQKSNPQR